MAGMEYIHFLEKQHGKILKKKKKEKERQLQNTETEVNRACVP